MMNQSETLSHYYKGAGEKVTFEDVLEVVSSYIHMDESVELIKKAYDFIMEKHEGQKRKSMNK